MNNFGGHNQLKAMATVITSTSSRTQKQLKKFKQLTLFLLIALAISLSTNGLLLYTRNSSKGEPKIDEEKQEQLKQVIRKLENQVSSLSAETKELNQSYNEAYKNNAEQAVLIKNLSKENESLKAVKERMQSMENIRKSYNQSLELTKEKK